MTFAAAYVLVLTLVGLALFASDRLRVDVVALILLLLLTLPARWVPELLTAGEALAGFGSETLVVLIALFVLTEGVTRTGVVERLGLRLASFGGGRPATFARLMLVAAALLSGFVSNTLTTAILLPLALGACQRAKMPASSLLMPLAFATILTGTLTVIGTSTNLVVSGLLTKEGLAPLGFFEMAPVGGVIAVLGLLYLLFVAPRLLPAREAGDPIAAVERRFSSEVVVSERSPFAGKTLAQLRLTEVLDLLVVGVSRGTRRLLRLGRNAPLQPGDRLIVEGRAKSILSVKDVAGIDIRPEVRHSAGDARAPDRRMLEVMVLPRSELVGATLAETRFGHRTGCAVLGIHSAGEEDEEVRLSRRALRAGDVLLLEGAGQDFERLPEGLMVLGDVSAHHPRSSKGVLAGAIFVGAIALAATGVLAMPVAFLLGVLLLLLTRCLTAEEAYGSVDWRLLVLIGVMLAFGTAMVKSGASGWLAQLAVTHVSPLGPRAILAAFYVLTLALSQPMSNQAAALIVVPIAVDAAQAMGMDPRPLVIGVALAASCSFLTPLEPACLLVYGPGRYRFVDFLRVGSPLTLVAFVVSMVMVPMLWPW
jgi:di/tricarboxylate transporter